VKVRLRNVEVLTASQWKKPGDHPAVTHKMLAEGGRAEYGTMGAGGVIVCPGDWIVTNEQGRHRVMTNEKFHASYEEVQ
jgi:hypothetical protein